MFIHRWESTNTRLPYLRLTHSLTQVFIDDHASPLSTELIVLMYSRFAVHVSCDSEIETDLCSTVSTVLPGSVTTRPRRWLTFTYLLSSQQALQCVQWLDEVSLTTSHQRQVSALPASQPSLCLCLAICMYEGVCVCLHVCLCVV